MATSWKSGIYGIVGGLAGAFIMQRFRILWDARTAASPETGIFGFDEEADINSVDWLTNLLSLPALSKEEALRAALVLHYAYGALAGGGYAVARDRYPAAGTAVGLLFGTALWAVGDELAMAVTRLSDPTQKTVASHGSALIAHLLFGATTEGCRRILQRSV